MQYQGTEYSVVQRLEGGFRWSFEIVGGIRTGFSVGPREVAIRRAVYEIDRALAPLKTKLGRSIPDALVHPVRGSDRAT
jgi:hypothetical protein